MSYLKQKEAAQYCNMSLNTFKVRVRPFVRHKKIGRSIYFSVEELDRFMRDNVADQLKVKEILEGAR